MAVNLSPFGGVGAQFLDNSGNVLTGGKIFTYAAGTTTNQATYTNATGAIPHSNPIILDAAGRVPGGEIWLTDGLQYKFVLKDSNDVLIATYDNVVGINSNFVNYATQQEVQTATAGQTIFTLTTINYTPGTNSLSVFVDGVNQYDGVSYAYVETDSTTVTFTSGLHVGALVKFTTAVTLSSGVTTADLVSYDPPLINSVPTTVEDKLAQYVSVKDFGAAGDGVTDDTVAIQNAIDSQANTILFPKGTYLISNALNGLSNNQTLTVEGKLLISVAKWLVIDNANYVKVTSVGGEICFDTSITNNTSGGIGAGIHITNSSYVEVSGFNVTTLNSDRTLTSFVVGTKSSVACIVRDNVLTDIGIGVIAGWTDDVSQQDENNTPTSKWAIENNTFNNCGRATYANIMVRSLNNSFSRTDPYALTAHRLLGNKINRLGGGGVSDIAIEYWSNGGAIAENVITGNAVDTYSHIAISCAKAYDLQISGNKIEGAWNYQGIELATCDSCVVDANRIYGALNTGVNSAAIGISAAVLNDPSSTGNTLSSNTIVNCFRGILLGGSGTSLATNTVITGNTFNSITSSAIYVAGSVTTVQVNANAFNSCATAIYSIGGVTTGSSYLNVIGNTFRNTTAQVLFSENNSGDGRPFRFIANQVYGWGSSTAPQAIMPRCVQSEIVNNTFADDGRSKSGFPGSKVYAVNRSFGYGTVKHIVRDNVVVGADAQLSISAISSDLAPINSLNVGGFYNNYSIHSYSSVNSAVPSGQVRIMDMAGPPLSGAWIVGDYVMNSAPTAGGNIGWVCTTAGSPGTWKTFGAIAA